MSAIHLTEDNFKSEVLESTQPVLVDFWAPWCSPCKMMGPIVEALTAELEGTAKVAKLDVDECPNLAQTYKVMSIPTFMVFKNGEVANTTMGAMPKEKLIDLLK